jgi:hypothetical protein
MTESQKAFEVFLSTPVDSFLDGTPITRKHQLHAGPVKEYVQGWMELTWQAGIAYGRKQALEEAIAICEDTPYRGDSYMEGVASCEERIKELTK